MSDYTLLKSKLHRATVTGASLHYEGSLTVDEDLARKAGFLPYEKILVGNINNGERFETYLIFGQPGTRVIELNGATAHLGKIGDRLTIMSFAQVPAELSGKHRPTIVRLDEKNNILI
jgi:aspartate 1-decarboxylase